jgi:hypothetical protein
MDNDLVTLIDGWFENSPLASFLGVSSIAEAEDIFGDVGISGSNSSSSSDNPFADIFGDVGIPGLNSSGGSDNPFADIFGDIGIPGLDTSPDGEIPFDGTPDENLFVNWNPLVEGSPLTDEDDGLLGNNGGNPFTGGNDPIEGELSNPFIPLPGEAITIDLNNSNAYLLRNGEGGWYFSTDSTIGSDDLTLGASTPTSILTSDSFFGQENPFTGADSPFAGSSIVS